MPAGVTSCSGKRRIGENQGIASQERAGDPGFFHDLAHRCVIRQLVRFDVSTGRQPSLQLVMKMEQDGAVMDDENRNGEIAGDRSRRHA